MATPCSLWEIDTEEARKARGQDKPEILPERRNYRAWRSWKLGGLLWEVVRRGDRACSLVPSNGNLNQRLLSQFYTEKQLGFCRYCWWAPPLPRRLRNCNYLCKLIVFIPETYVRALKLSIYSPQTFVLFQNFVKGNRKGEANGKLTYGGWPMPISKSGGKDFFPTWTTFWLSYHSREMQRAGVRREDLEIADSDTGSL